MLKNIFYNSLLYRLLIDDTLNDARSNSKIIGFFKSLFDSLNGFVDNLALSEILRASFIYKLINKIFDKVHILAGLIIVLTIIVPHKYWNNIYSLLLTGLLVFIYLFKRLSTPPLDSKDKAKLDILTTLFIFQVFISAASSLIPSLSIKYIFFFLNAFIMMFIILKEANTKERIQSFINLFLIGVSFTGIYGLYQKIKGVPVNPSYVDMRINEGMFGRIFSTMENPNNFGELLILALPFFIAFILNEKNPRKRFFYCALSIPVVISLVFTGTRSAWVSFAIGVFVFICLKNIRLLPIFALLGIAGFISLPFISPAVYRRILTIFNPNDASTSYRGLILDTVWPMIGDYGLFGVGLGTDVFKKICSTYFQFTKNNVVHSHNLYIQILIEMGILSLIFFLGTIYRTLKGLYFIVDRSINTELKNLAIASVASLLSILVMAFIDYVWFYPRILLIFWAIMGLAFAIISVGKREII